MTINAWGSDDPAEVAKGGTGVSTIASNQIMIGDATSPIVTEDLTDGELLIGSTGASPVGATMTGDSNEMDVATAAGSITIGIADNPEVPTTGSMTIPAGTTAQRPGSPATGMFRYDSDLNTYQVYNGTTWETIIGVGGSWVYLATQSASSASSIVFSNTDFDGAFTRYMVVCENLNIDTTTFNDYWLLQVSSSGTPTTTGYNSVYLGAGDGTPIFNTSTNGFRMRGNNSRINQNRECYMRWFLSNMETASSYPRCTSGGLIQVGGAGVSPAVSNSGGYLTTSGTYDGCVIRTGLGNNITGTAHLYGLVQS